MNSDNYKRIIPWPICVLFDVVAVGCCWGFYEAFAKHDEVQIAADFKNWPFLFLIIFLAVRSWFEKA
jgi:hypothetical protein